LNDSNVITVEPVFTTQIVENSTISIAEVVEEAQPQILLSMEPESGLQEPTFAETTPSSSPSILRALLGFSGVLLICYFSYQSYIYISDKALLADCNGDKRLFRKIKRGSIYRIDLEGSKTPLRSTKSWANDVEDDGESITSYQKLA
jgi:hypothetical protein